MCEHEWHHYPTCAVFGPDGTPVVGMDVEGGFSLCIKCRQVAFLYPGETHPTVCEAVINSNFRGK